MDIDRTDHFEQGDILGTQLEMDLSDIRNIDETPPAHQRLCTVNARDLHADLAPNHMSPPSSAKECLVIDLDTYESDPDLIDPDLPSHLSPIIKKEESYTPLSSEPSAQVQRNPVVVDLDAVDSEIESSDLELFDQNPRTIKTETSAAVTTDGYLDQSRKDRNPNDLDKPYSATRISIQAQGLDNSERPQNTQVTGAGAFLDALEGIAIKR